VLRLFAIFWLAYSAYCKYKGNLLLHCGGASGLLLDQVLTLCMPQVQCHIRIKAISIWFSREMFCHAWPARQARPLLLSHGHANLASVVLHAISACHCITGERRKRQQAASLGVSPTVVARSQMSARSVAQQQVLTQRQRREGPAAVAQQAAAEKLQMEQQALERDYEQLRQERLRSVSTTYDSTYGSYGNSVLVDVSNAFECLSKWGKVLSTWSSKIV